jgi:PKD repeat protein
MSDYIYGIGQELRFNTLGTDLTHTWDFGDSTPISSDPSPTHIYSIPGTYTVIHGARDFCGSCTSISHTVDIVTASITIRSLLLNTYTAKVGDIVTATVIAQNLSPTFGTGTIVVRFDSIVAGTFNATLDSNQEVSFDISRQVTTAGTINVCADNVCTVLFVESNVRVQSITLDTNISTSNPIMAIINVQNTGTFTENKTIQTTLTNSTTVVIDERIVTALPGTITYQVPVTITGLSNGLYTLCAENICKALSVAIPTETTGRLSISSTPIGAEIFVDGQSTSQYTNATVIGISPENHTFTLKLNGYNDTVGPFTITVGMITYIYTALSPMAPTMGSINISSTPTEAEIYLDSVQQFDINNDLLLTPATITDLSPIGHNITLKLPDYIDYNKTIDIIAGQTTYLSAYLIRSPILIGNINFITMPIGAEIFIDNVSTGQTTPATIANVPIGPHEFILRYPGRNDSTGTIDVIGGTTSYVHVDMSIVPSTVGDLNISTIPTGVEIWIDNVQQFDTNNQPLITPTTITDLSPENYNITLKLSGYIDYNQTMSITAGQTTYLGASLIQTPITIGNINFVTNPVGASIFIDDIEKIGRLTPTTITDVPIGSHTFILKYLGRNDATGSIDVTGGTTSYIYIDMTITPPTEGNIAISSAPTNVEIWIDGVRQLDTNSNPLLTPSTITGLTPINHDIKLKLSGYIDYDTTVNITAGQTIYLSASLMQAPILIGDINFTTTPDGASIFIDNQEQVGKFTPTTITDISIGNHTFILKYPGRNDATGTITVIGGATSYIYVSMSIVSPTKGSISISSIPQNADIYIDDTLYSTKTPATIDELTPNVYTIVLKKDGYNDYTTMINSIAGQTISINITLIPKVTMVVGLEFPWWLALGLGVGMFYAGKYRELKDIRQIVSSDLPFQHKGKVVTLTKNDYKVT